MLCFAQFLIGSSFKCFILLAFLLVLGIAEVGNVRALFPLLLSFRR